MNSPTNSVQPPRLALWLVALFASDEHAESIVGDLHEEFAALASQAGTNAARSWFWRQTGKTIVHLTAAGVRAAPWQTAASVAAGFLLIAFGSRFAAQATQALFDHYGFYGYLSELGMRQPSLDVAPYLFWISRSVMLEHVLLAALVGGIVAMAAKGREMTVTTALGLFLIVLAVAGGLLMVARTSDYTFFLLRGLPLAFLISLAIVAGGAIVRTLRSPAARPSAPRPFAS